MKKIILYMTLCLIGMVQVACDQDIDGFDNSTNYIYFDLPFQLDQYGRKTTERVDSLVYSFAMDDPSVTSYTFKIPVNSVGLKTETDRHYKVVVNENYCNRDRLGYVGYRKSGHPIRYFTGYP